MHAIIKNIDAINSVSSVALVQMLHEPNTKITAEDIAQSISSAVDSELAVVSGSSSVIETGRGVTMVRCLMNRTEQVAPLESNHGMVALSANMYMDASERMWALRSSESGDVLVRQASADDNEELINMIRSFSSVSSASFQAQMPSTYSAMKAYENQLTNAVAGDMASYVSESGNLEVGFIVTEVHDLGKKSFVMLSNSGDNSRVLPQQLVAVLGGDQIEASAFPPVDSVSAALGHTVEKLVDYYKKVYSYRPDYLEKLVARIRAHSF